MQLINQLLLRRRSPGNGDFPALIVLSLSLSAAHSVEKKVAES